MPWSLVSTMDQKLLFISAYIKQNRSITELALDFNISRKTAHKWIKRYLEMGPMGLDDRPKTAFRVHNSIPQFQVDEIIAIRKEHPSWGSKKIFKTLFNKHPSWKLMARSTICDILKRNGLTKKSRRARKLTHPGKPTEPVLEPNDLWTVDFKGQFKTKDGIYCYPLTVTDAHSRFLFSCDSSTSPSFEHVKSVFIKLFKQYGIPKRIRSDNGSPFASTSIARLSKLSVWWIKLGIQPELIEPGKPQQNGSHERMHRTLKAETTRPPAGNIRAQQRRFNKFREEYNHVRPHEALDQATPASVYRKSDRKFPNQIPKIIYPIDFEIRYVSANGCVRWKSQWVRVGTPLIGENIAFEPIDEYYWNVYFSNKRIGIYHEKLNRIEDPLGRYTRKTDKKV